MFARRHKTKSRIKIWMTKHDHRLVLELSRGTEASLDKGRSETPPLIRRRYGEWGQGQRWCRADGDPAQQDMAHDLTLALANQRQSRIEVTAVSQVFDQLCFRRPTKRRHKDRANGFTVVGCFRTDVCHRLT